jgi:hypothetical protein
MEATIVYDFRESNYIKKLKAKYVLFDDKYHDLYFIYADGSRVSFIQNDYPIVKIEMLYGDEYETAEVVLSMEEPNWQYDIPENISWIRWTVTRPDRKVRV